MHYLENDFKRKAFPIYGIVMHVLIWMLLSTHTQAWSCPGHMVTAHIAARVLGQAFVQDNFKPLIDLMSQTYGSVNTLTSAACWADDIRWDHNYTYDTWHYADECFSVDTTLCPTSYGVGNTSQRGRLLTQLPYLIQMYRNNTQATDASHQAQQAFALYFVLHLAGDLHQPLHVASEWSTVFPDGDAGGNLFLIQLILPHHAQQHRAVSLPSMSMPSLPNTTVPLHTFCDQIGYDDQLQDEFRPFDGTQRRRMDAFISSLLLNYTFTTDETNFEGLQSIAMWAAESYELGRDVIYDQGQLKPYAFMSQTDVEKRHQVLLRRLALGGLRLANVLKWMVGGHETTDENTGHTHLRKD